jgi:hypothetical protein
MGRTRGIYNAEFPTGSRVRVQGRERLEQFARDWKYHHPLGPEQFGYASAQARVKDVAFYHGGDELYTLEGVPGIWHESCLEECSGVDGI